MREPDNTDQRPSVLPLAVAVLDGLLTVAAGLVGGVAMLWNGEWLALLTSLGAAIVYPTVFLILHWLRLLTDVPSMFAARARWGRLADLLQYVSDVLLHALVLGWVALVFILIWNGHATLGVLAWGFAVVTAPLLAIILRPLGYPMLLWACLMAQLAWPLLWCALRYHWLERAQVLPVLGVVVLVAPLIGFSRRWQRWTAPD